MTELDDFLRLLHPNKTMDEIKLNTKDFEKNSIEKPIEKNTGLASLISHQLTHKEIKEEIKEEVKEKHVSRREKRFLERQDAKKNKPVKENTQKTALALKLEKVKTQTRMDVGLRLGPILFGVS